MLRAVFSLLISKRDFFGKLFIEHIEISLAAILIAIIFGGAVGILISEYSRSSRPTFSGIGNATVIIALTI